MYIYICKENHLCCMVFDSIQIPFLQHYSIFTKKNFSHIDIGIVDHVQPMGHPGGSPGHLLLLPVVDDVVTMQYRLAQDEEFGAQGLWKLHLEKIAGKNGPGVAEKLVETGKNMGKFLENMEEI